MPPKARESGSKKHRTTVPPPHPVPPATQPQPAPTWPAIRPHVWRILALWALALLAYSNSFRAGLTLDNATVIAQDSRIQAATSANVGLIFSQEYWYRNATTNLYRPLTTLSYLINYSVLGNGPNPAGYHLVNLALHAINILLVYVLGLILLRQMGLALGLAGLWGLHPVLTESVTNIVGRADILAGFGVLAGLLCYIRAATATGARRVAWLMGLALATAVGIFSKESGIVILAIVPLYDFTFGRDLPWRTRLAGYAAMLPPIAGFFYCRAAMLATNPIAVVPFVDNPLQGADFLTSRLTAVKVIGRLFALFLWPATLSCDYSYNQIPLFSWSLNCEDAQSILVLLACAAVAAIAIRFRRHSAMVFFVAFWFLALAPTANIALRIGSVMAERFLYLPALGLAGCLVLAIAAVARRFTPSPESACKAAAAIVGVICLAYSVRTFVRNADWRDEVTLWTSAVHSSPGSFRAHVSLANSLGAAGTQQADIALRILDTLPDDRSNSVGYYLAGLCYRKKGDADPSASQYWYTKARDTLARGERIDRIENEHARTLNLALSKGPYLGGQARLYLELGRVYRLVHQPKDALDTLAAGRAISPAPEFSEERSLAYRQLGDRDGAAIALMEGLVLDPGATSLAPSLLKVYQDFYPDSCAVSQSNGPSSINMECPLVHGQLCAASRNVALDYQARGRTQKATTTARTAITQLGCPTSLFQ
jgi:protein O-mannosyl-transferase